MAYKDLTQADSEVVMLIEGFDHDYTLIGSIGDELYFRSNDDAPRNRLIAIDVNDPAPDAWREVIPEARDVLSAILHHGAQKMLAAAIENEVDEYIAAHADHVIYSTEAARADAERWMQADGRVPGAIVAPLGVEPVTPVFSPSSPIESPSGPARTSVRRTVRRCSEPSAAKAEAATSSGRCAATASWCRRICGGCRLRTPDASKRFASSPATASMPTT